MSTDKPVAPAASNWLRVRFEVPFEASGNDPRPVKFPPPGPYWVSGQTETAAILIAYLRDERDLGKFWPEAENPDWDERDEITFTDRFPKPDWWKA